MSMHAPALARIEFRQAIGTFTDAEREALIEQLLMATRRIQSKTWDIVDVVFVSAPDETP